MSKDSSTGFVYDAICKRCGNGFNYTPRALFLEIARGLSKPERCTECRRKHRSFLNSVGTGYVETLLADPTEAIDFSLRGVARLGSPARPVKATTYSGAARRQLQKRFEAIDPVVQNLLRELEDPNGARVNVLIGPTGSGKSVYFTYQLLESSLSLNGTICVTQPRLVTLRSSGTKSDRTTPNFIARQLLGAAGAGAGQDIGYLFRGESEQQDKYTRLLFVTDGILIRWLVNDDLDRFSVIVIDEAHEQSSNMELIFALLRYKLPFFPRLKVVIASATVDPVPFQRYFGYGDPSRVKVFSAGGPTPHPIYDRWPDGDDGYMDGLRRFELPTKPDEVPEAAANVVSSIRRNSKFTKLQDSQGDVIIFVPTIALVQRTVRAIENLRLPGTEAIPCFAQMPDVDYDRFRSSEVRADQAGEAGKATSPSRVIIATNYAETSVTLSNLKYVVDSGYIMEPVWDPVSHSRSYPTHFHSQAGVRQRRGRVGRNQPGEVFYLFTHEQFEDRSNFSPAARPAISREQIDKFLLTAKAAGIENLEAFEWLGLDSKSAIQMKERSRALGALTARGAVDANGKLSQRGVELERIEAGDIDLAHILRESDRAACALEISTFLAFLDQPRKLFDSSPGGLISRFRWSVACRDDLEFYLRLFNQWKRSEQDESGQRFWCERFGLNHRALKDIERRRFQLLRQFLKRTSTSPDSRELDVERLHRARCLIMRALPEWVLKRSTVTDATSPLVPVDQGCPAKGELFIDRESAAHLRGKLNYCICLERQKVGEKVYGRAVVRIQPEWVDLRHSLTPIDQALLFWNQPVVENNVRDMGELFTSPPTLNLDVSKFPAGRSFLSVVIQRFVEDGSGATTTYLMQDTETKSSFLAEISDMVAEPGDLYRAQVISADSERSFVSLSRRFVADKFRPGTIVRNSRIRRFAGPEDSYHSLLVDLEPGVYGRVYKRMFGRSEGHFLSRKPGERIDVKVKSIGSNGPELEYLVPEPTLRGKYTGYVTNILFSQDGRTKIGAFVEFLPFREGLLRSNKPSGYSQRVLKIGDRVSVTLTEIFQDKGKTRFELS